VPTSIVLSFKNLLKISTVHLKYQIKIPTISGRVNISAGHLGIKEPLTTFNE
jgi:hypothetical protein